MKINYQKQLDDLIQRLSSENRVPTLLLHSCCAPCSSYVLEYLSEYFKITVFYYNPNIYPDKEYFKRVNEQKMFITQMNGHSLKNHVDFIEGEYNTKLFYENSRGFENEREGGERCFRCYRMRLEEAAKLAAEHNFEYFTTTLSISPYKNAEKLNEIGKELQDKYGVEYLYSDFKKKNGYKRSIELSSEYGLYRQDYCGCVYSKTQAENDRKFNNKD